MIQYESELLHHGVKGMKWGVRRYQNYDGSYTQQGLKRWNAAKSLYDEADKKYKNAKSNFKSAMNNLHGRRTKFEERPSLMNKVSETKRAMKQAKRERKHEKKELSKAYSHLKQDKRADKGKQLYTDGKTITAGHTLTAKMLAAGTTLSAIGIGMQKNYIGTKPLVKGVNKAFYSNTKEQIKDTISKNSSPAVIATGAGAAIAAFAVGKKIYDYNKNKKLRAYYGHNFYKRGKTNKKYEANKRYNRNEAMRIVKGR